MRGSAQVLRPDDSVEGLYHARGASQDLEGALQRLGSKPSAEKADGGDGGGPQQDVAWGRSLKQWTSQGGPTGSPAALRLEAKAKRVAHRVPAGMSPIANTPNGPVICESGFFRPEAEPDKVYRSYGEWWMSVQQVDKLKPSGNEYSNRLWPYGDGVKTVEGRADYHDFYMLDRRKMQFSSARKSFAKSEDGRFSNGPLRSSARQSFVMPAYAKQNSTT